MTRASERSKIWQLTLLAFAMIIISCFARTQVAWGAGAVRRGHGWHREESYDREREHRFPRK